VTDKTEITVLIPAQSRFVALARVTAASLAAELDFTLDEIADFRVGADELTSLLMEWAEDHGVDTLEIRYRLTEDTVEMEAAAQPLDDDSGAADGPQALDEITRQILAAVVDTYEIRAGCGWILKRRASS
jgi:anti-sigma regulatory factor (Ser/Thr protein kinase)